MISQQHLYAHPSSSHLSPTYKGYFQVHQEMSMCSGIGLSASHSVDICSSTVLHGLKQDNLPHCVLPYCLWGNLFSGAWSTPSSPPSLTLTFSLLFLPFLPPSHCSLSGIFFPFLRRHHTLADGLSCILQWVFCGASWTQLCLAQGSPWSHRDYSAAHLLLRPCHPHSKLYNTGYPIQTSDQAFVLKLSLNPFYCL